MDDPSVEEVADRYLRGRVARGEVAAATAEKLGHGLGWLAKAADGQPVSTIDRRTVERVMELTAHHKPATRRLRHTAYVGFCDWLVDEEYLTRNPFRKVRPPRKTERPPRALPNEAVSRLLNVVPDLRARLIVILMVQQGMRCIEVSNLRISDIDLDARHMRLRGKFGNERILPIMDECAMAMKEYLERWPAEPGDPLIRAWQHKGRSMKIAPPRATSRPLGAATISKWMAGWMYDAGIKREPGDGVSAHALRHTCATDMLSGGADIMEVRDTLGHTSVATTQIYLSVQPERLARAMTGRTYGPA